MAVGKWKIPLFLAIASLLCIGGITYLVMRWAQASVSYVRLESMLQSSDWEAANDETNRILLKLSRRNILPLAHLFRNLAATDFIECQDLETIDNIWMLYSNGKFGLGQQSLKGKEKIKGFDWEARSYGFDGTGYEKVEMAFSEVTERSEEIFSTNSAEVEPGRLPTHYWLIDGRLDGEVPPFSANAFFTRIENCKINSNF